MLQTAGNDLWKDRAVKKFVPFWLGRVLNNGTGTDAR